MNTWMVDRGKVLSRQEIGTILADLKRRSRRSVNSRMNLVVFRLATCCGLRASEICQIRMRDIHLARKHPYIQIPRVISKSKKPRRVPLWWDAGTLSDVENWKEERAKQGAGPSDSFVCAQSKTAAGKPLSRFNVRNRFISSMGILGEDRQADLTTHCGRHTFVSHAIKKRSIPEVRDAAGHSSLNTTSIYAHVIIDEQEEPGDLFDY
jgi:integrase